LPTHETEHFLAHHAVSSGRAHSQNVAVSGSWDRDCLSDKLIELVSILAELEVAVAICPCGGIENINGQGTLPHP
jgi:hypothetical protein